MLVLEKINQRNELLEWEMMLPSALSHTPPVAYNYFAKTMYKSIHIVR